MLHKLLVALLIFSLTATKSKADPVEVKQNEKAPFTGLLFSQPKAETIRRELLERDALSEINKTMREVIDVQRTQIKLRGEQLQIQQKDIERLRDTKSISNTERIIWFALGIAATSAAVYGASSLSK